MDTPVPVTLSGQLLKSLEQHHIPPSPEILRHVICETRKAEPDLRRLAVLISGDVGIAASLLKTVNSPFYGLPGKAHTVQQAISLLGINATANAVASIALQRALPAPPQWRQFWDSSMKIARLSGWLAQHLRPRVNLSADLAYTSSLFRDAGTPIMFKHFPDYQATLEEASNCPKQPFTRIEEARHSTSHALIGYLLTQSWWLSPATCLAVRDHHDSELVAVRSPGLAATARDLIMLAHLAEHLLERITGQRQSCEWEKMGASICARLELDDAALQALAEQAQTLPLSY